MDEKRRVFLVKQESFGVDVSRKLKTKASSTSIRGSI
jgi:hypothetical protein